jgi:hypothetical protein
MDHDAAQQPHLNAMATQYMLAGMSDNPRQFRGEDPMAALFKQCWREKYGHRDGMSYMTVPF